MDHTSSTRTHPDQAGPPGAVACGELVTDDQVSGWWAAAETARGRVCVRLLDHHPAGAPAAHGRVTQREVVVHGPTERQFRDLEAALGLPEFGLGRYKPWAAPDGVHLDGDQYDVDAVVGFAEANGLAYEQTVTTRQEADPTRGGAADTSDDRDRP